MKFFFFLGSTLYLLLVVFIIGPITAIWTLLECFFTRPSKIIGDIGFCLMMIFVLGPLRCYASWVRCYHLIYTPPIRHGRWV